LTKNYALLPVWALGAAMLAHAQSAVPAPASVPPQTSAPSPAAAPGQTKIGLIHIQNAIISTKDGQKAANELTVKFGPKKAELDKKRDTIAQLQDQLRKGSNTMSEDAKQKLMREIDQDTRALNRDTEDAQAELDQEQNRVMQELGQRMMAIIMKYGNDHAFTIILDVSSPQTPVLWAANGTDITQDIIALYDKNSSPAASSSAVPMPKPAPPAAKPAPPAGKQ
jgi:outer membrane protein